MPFCDRITNYRELDQTGTIQSDFLSGLEISSSMKRPEELVEEMLRKSLNASLCRNIENDGGHRNWDACDLGRNLASWNSTYSRDGAQK